ncbi:protein of unknown function [Kushneria avicenniae]|uniref:DUF4168 domain-containing protein n=1 Tax=Kushneria avicenniae TaxID=402385 RepID=A0A1I1JF29_9GAMM|nr:DUF4168 domain-containing protein [Kushneria avicenniae]SFC46965.1 protein of unknown function [Kushneria avicenniae]
MKKPVSMLGAALITVGLLTAPMAMAGSQSAQQGQSQARAQMQQPQPVEPGTLSKQYQDDELRSFLDVNRDMIPVIKNLSSQNVSDQQQAQSMMQEFQSKTEDSLKEHDLSVQQYQQIGTDASRDKALEERLINMDPQLYKQLQSMQSQAQQQPAQ